MPVLLIAILVAVFITLGVLAAQAAKKRRLALAAWAQGCGLGFDPSRDGSIEQRFAEFSCLRHGDNRYAENRISGTFRGREMLAFDYHYETHSTDSKGHRQTHHHRFSAVVMESPVPLQSLSIRPEGLMDKITEFFGAEDIDFESAEFSRKFFVKAPNRRWAFDVLHPRAMEMLLANPGFAIEMAPRRVMIRRGATFAPEQFAQAAGVAADLLDALPQYVVRQQTGQG